MSIQDTKDPYIMLSRINTKLRDECASLEELCKAYDLSQESLLNRMKEIDYSYQESSNQFIPN